MTVGTSRLQASETAMHSVSSSSSLLCYKPMLYSLNNVSE